MAAKKPPEKIIELMKKHKIQKGDLWDCRGTWVLLHRAVEMLGAAEGVSTEIELVHLNMERKEAAVVCRARRENQVFASFGEAAPANNKNAYPLAMAEKRAVDRATLKALALHGHIYSEIEADDFKRGASRPQPAAAGSGSNQIDDVRAKMSRVMSK